MRREPPRARGNRSFLSAAILLAAFSAFASFPGDVAGSTSREAGREDALKAGYLFNFIKFVEWPAAATGEPFTMCFIGESGVYAELASVLPDKRMGSRTLVARRLSSSDELNACQVLYVDAKQLQSAASAIGMHPVALLTVSDAPGFLQSGGIIGLFAEGNRLRFRISVENARRANLKISSNLLQLASEVKKSG
jgi:hypothetical protein